MVRAAKEELLNDGRRREEWYIAAQARLMPPTAKQNDTMRVLNRTWTPAAKGAVRSVRKAARREVDAAKAAWVLDDRHHPTLDDERPVTPKTARNAIRLLTRGPNARKEVKIMQLYKDQSAGSGSGICTAPEENRGVMVGSLRKTFSQAGTPDPTAVAKVRQRPQQPWMDRT